MNTKEDADDFIERLKQKRLDTVVNPKKVSAGDIELLKSMDEKQLKYTIDYIKGNSFPSRVEIMRNIVDNVPLEDIKHPNCRKIFSTFEEEVNKV